MQQTKQLLATIILLVIALPTIAQNTFPSTGSVGIGTLSPAGTLEIKSGTNQRVVVGNVSGYTRPLDINTGGTYIGLSRPEDGVIVHGIYSYNSTSKNNLAIGTRSDLVFLTGENGPGLQHERMRIAENGNIGIGTSSPGFRLDVADGFRVRNWSEGSNTYTTFRIQGGQTFTHGLEIDFFGDSTLGDLNGTYQAGYGGGAIINVNPKPLVLGTDNQPRIYIASSGDVGIGTTQPESGIKLSVNGNIKTKKIIVSQTGWPDYVFHPSYKLRPLSEIAAFIRTNQHLPDVPSAKEVEEKGISLGDNQAVLLKKIEELTLYIIDMKLEIEQLKKRIK